MVKVKIKQSFRVDSCLKVHTRTVELINKIREVEDEKQQLEDLQRQLPTLEKKLTETKEELESARSEAIDFSSVQSKLNASEADVKEQSVRCSRAPR